jgi:hypothetical protein
LTRLIFDKKDANILLNVGECKWTTARLRDEFFVDLTKIGNKKYYEQAKDLIYRIPLTKQYPKSEEEGVPFKIIFNELSIKVQAELIEYCRSHDKRQVTIFLKEVVIRLFENIDFEYSHMSVMKKLRVKVV